MVAAILLAGSLFLIAPHTTARAEAPEAPADAVNADRAFFDAIASSKGPALRKMLDADFTWTDSNGRALNREQTVRFMPKPGIIDEGSEVRTFGYGNVAVFEANAGKMHGLRVWVKRPAGWRVLVYQEVRSLDKPLSFTPGAPTGCSNPCKSINYKPRNDTERGVVAAYEALESAAVARNATAWGAVTAPEFVAASSNSTELLDRATRMAELAQSNMVGLSPTPLLEAELYDFPQAVVMKSQHQPVEGLPLVVTRVWVQRGDNWLATLSYQTAVQPAGGH